MQTKNENKKPNSLSDLIAVIKTPTPIQFYNHNTQGIQQLNPHRNLTEVIDGKKPINVSSKLTISQRLQ